MLAKVTRQSVNGCQVLFDMTSLIFCNASRALNEWLNECRRGEFDSAGVMMSEPNNREIYWERAELVHKCDNNIYLYEYIGFVWCHLSWQRLILIQWYQFTVGQHGLLLERFKITLIWLISAYFFTRNSTRSELNLDLIPFVIKLNVIKLRLYNMYIYVLRYFIKYLKAKCNWRESYQV